MMSRMSYGKPTFKFVVFTVSCSSLYICHSDGMQSHSYLIDPVAIVRQCVKHVRLIKSYDYLTVLFKDN